MGTCITRQDDCADQKNVDSYDVQCVVSSEDMRVDKFTIITSTPSQQQEITKQSQVNDEKVYRSRPHYLEDTDTSDQESSCSEESDEFDTDMEDCLKEMVTLLDNGYIPSNTKNNEWGNIASMISYNSYLNFKKDSSKINELCALIEDSFEDQLAHLIGISSDIVDDEEIVQHVGGNFTQNRLEEHDDSRRKYERLSLQMFPEEIIYRREILEHFDALCSTGHLINDSKGRADVLVNQLQSAFDTVLHQRLLLNLENYGIRGNLLSFSPGSYTSSPAEKCVWLLTGRNHIKYH
ncbi:hypothetical protein DPMN_180287 [Dreissena polymorpha]|uniref:Uncharacterized protein n=1 Tax=Dreissena polymorpha TaxID=45954 RepID=A0A9D4EIQ7_DREPO|nr:hypothetical protein DPMN_180287 [Dreissena polymorpha]